jgi:hypothetical protein
MFLPSVCSIFFSILSAIVTHQTRRLPGFGSKKCEGILKNKQHIMSLPPFTLYYSLNTKTHRLRDVSSRQGYTQFHGSSTYHSEATAFGLLGTFLVG